MKYVIIQSIAATVMEVWYVFIKHLDMNSSVSPQLIGENIEKIWVTVDGPTLSQTAFKYTL